MCRQNTIGFKIRLIHNQIHKIMEAKRVESEDDLTGMQRWIIGFLIDHAGEDVFQRDIETAFSVSRATASNMLAVMERRGFIARETVASDARLKKLVVLDKARKMQARARQDVREMEEQLIRGMGDDEVAQLTALLDRVLGNLGVGPENGEHCGPKNSWQKKNPTGQKEEKPLNIEKSH